MLIVGQYTIRYGVTYGPIEDGVNGQSPLMRAYIDNGRGEWTAAFSDPPLRESVVAEGLFSGILQSVTLGPTITLEIET